MAVEKFTISRDDSVYECFPHLCRTESGRILLTYRESNGHVASDFSRLIVRYSDDAGKSWSDRNVITETHISSGPVCVCNCPKIQQLKDGRILLICDRYDYPPGEWYVETQARLTFWFSDDEGGSFSEPEDTVVRGICPDEVSELPDGQWLVLTAVRDSQDHILQMLTISRDKGQTWEEPYPLIRNLDYELDEGSIVPRPGGELVSYLRDDSGRPLQKMISKDCGITWEGPFDTLNPAAIGMPIARLTQDNLVLVSGRFGVPGRWRVDMSEETWEKRIAKRGIVIPKVTDNLNNMRFVNSVERTPYMKETKNELVLGMGGSSIHTFAFLEPAESALNPNLGDQKGLLLPLDLDSSPFADSGYTGWVEYERGKFLVVNYINDDAPLAQIRGYRFGLEDF